MNRTDTHRPSAINPAEYEYVAQEMVKIEDPIGDCAYQMEMRRIIREHMARTGGNYSGHAHGGNCMVCGNAQATYTVLFYHRPTNTYVRMGTDCARKCEMGGNLDTAAFRQAVEDARLAQAGKRKAQVLLADAGRGRAWELYLAGWDGDLRKEERTILDIVERLVKYGSISDKAMDYVGKLLEAIATRPEREAAEAAERAAAADCPEGRLTITGTVLTVRVDDTAFGPTTKMLVKADAGYKVWGTRPAGSNAEKGDRVEFTATLERARDDAKFGFYKRPTNCTVVRAA